MDLQELLAPVAGESNLDDALDSWRWLVTNAVSPLVATAFGDLFVMNDSGSVSFLDIIAGKFETVAGSVAEWEERLRDREFLEQHFMPSFVLQLREAGCILAQGECYVPKHEPVLGGSWSLENWSAGSWIFHLERQGRVHFAIKDLPSDTVITKWDYTEL